MNEQFIRTLIYTHATLGGIALLSGLVALATPKGTKPHKKGGIVFYYCMLGAALLAIAISVMPNHHNYFLFAIGIFSSYMILTGKRILALKSLYTGVKPGKREYVLPAIMLATGIAMILYGSYLKFNYNNNAGIVLIVFGSIGLSMSIGDIRLFSNEPTDKRFWLYQHITKMTGGYIAAVTAFVVVNRLLPGLWAWLTPTVIGTIYITYFQRKFRKQGERILKERNIE